MRTERTQVVIVGGGPNGISAAHHMGLYNIDCVVLEVATDVLPYPRAVGMDDEALRVLQTVGVADVAHKDMIAHVPLRYFNARGICFAEVNPVAMDYGWPMRNLFMQQILEATLREELQRRPSVQLRLGHEMLTLKQSAERVELEVKSPDGEVYRLEAQYVIGADGGRSSVRKQLGIELVGLTHPRKWVVVDAANDALDAPYTALHADPRRPFVCIQLPYRQRRWEFMLFEHESEEQMCEEANIRSLIRRHIGDAEKDLEIIRIRAYTHNSRVADRFVEGRVALIGDAAHITPPWAGQGLNSGLRDVANLCWKVAAAARGLAGPALVQTYDLERRGHATDLITLADNMGTVLGMTDPLLAGVRDWVFRAVDTVDSLRQHLLEFKFKPKAVLTQGLVHRDHLDVREDDLVGQLFIQPDVEDDRGRRQRLDEVLGPWFAVLGQRANPLDHLSESTRKRWEALGTRFIQVNRSRSGQGHGQPLTVPGITCVEDVDNRLDPWFSRARESFVVIRPDRFVAAVVSAERLESVMAGLISRITSP